MLHPDNKTVIEATAGVVADNAVAITTTFYQRMFTAQPELRDLFNQANQATGDQSVALASSIVAYARHLLGLDDVPFDHVVSRIAHKHVALGVSPQNYTVVGRHLMAAIGDVLGDAVTADVAAAWEEVYWLFAVDLVSAEAKIYTNLGVTPETVFSDLVLDGRRSTAPGVYTLRFSIADTDFLSSWVPGQYVSVVAPCGDGHRQPRQYTISDAGDDWFDITVKHVAGTANAPAGQVSSVLAAADLGSTWPVSRPCGDISIASSSKPAVLISAGVGITPMAAVLSHAARHNSGRHIWHIHADSSTLTMPLMAETADKVQKLPHAQQQVYFDDTNPFTAEAISQLDVPSDSLFYLCGPIPFMRDVRRALLAQGVCTDNIEYEVFGPDLWLADSAAVCPA